MRHSLSTLGSAAIGGLMSLAALPAQATPVFARQYSISCATCHSAFPKLNAFGEDFRASNMRLPDWKEKVGVDTNDDMLVLPQLPPLAFRAQAFVQSREADAVDSSGNVTANGDLDFQTPYLLKLYTSAPLSDHMTYYLYMMLAEKGENGVALVEDAWISHDDVFGTGVSLTAGQFQLADLMFSRETRMTFQDFIPYRMAGLTYQRGLFLSRSAGPVSLTLGAANGNGIEANDKIDSAGYQRPDRAFDTNRRKTLFGRLGAHAGPVKAGLFLADGNETKLGDTRVTGLDLSGDYGKLSWFTQLLQTEWSNVVDNITVPDATWYSGFAGVDYIHNDRWAYSLLYNHGDANDLSNTRTYAGIDLDSVTLAANYYFMRNVKGVMEVNIDLLAADGTRDGIGHDTKEGYLLFGIDATF